MQNEIPLSGKRAPIGIAYDSRFAPICACVVLVIVPSMLVGPQILDVMSVPKAVLSGKVRVTAGWTTATFPHPIDEARHCRNPLRHAQHPESGEVARLTYFCDPDEVLDSSQVARITDHIVQFQRAVNVSCALGSSGSSLNRPFFVGVAIMKKLGLHYGEAEVDASKCSSGEACLSTEVDWFGDGILSVWGMAFRNGKEYCPNGGVIVVFTDQNYARFVVPTEYFVTKSAGKDIMGFMNKHFGDGDWEGGLHAGVDGLRKYFERVYSNQGYTPMYWGFMICATVTLTLGLAIVLYAQVRNQSDLDDLDWRDGLWGIVGCVCYGTSAFTSILGVYMMTSLVEYWNPAAGDSVLSFTPLIALVLCCISIPVCCPLSFGSIIQNSAMHPSNWRSAQMSRQSRMSTYPDASAPARAASARTSVGPQGSAPGPRYSLVPNT